MHLIFFSLAPEALLPALVSEKIQQTRLHQKTLGFPRVV